MIDLRTAQGWQDLKAALDDRPHDVLAMCGIDVNVRSAWTLINDPLGDGRECFGLCLRADGLSWKKFNGTQKGRSLELIAYCHGWYDQDKRGADPAARLALQRLGLGTISAEQLEKDRAAAKARTQRAREEEGQRRARTARVAFAIWAKSEKILGEPQNLAEMYLREARGIDLRQAPFIGPRGGRIAPGSLRFVPAHKYVIRDRGNKPLRDVEKPALVACCVDKDSQIRALHQTWLDLRAGFPIKADIPPAPDGAVQPARKVLGEFSGCVIPLWKGEGHFSVKDACANGLLQTLILTEGVEDGLSAILAAPQHRVWAMISLSNMANVAARLPDCIESVIVHRQNDWEKPAAVAAFDRGLQALRATGRLVAEVHATIGKDLNDTLRGAA